MAGLTAAHGLQREGHEVTVLEKARGAGGRMASRRHERWCFDHGAQYFTARDARFIQQVESWRERGLVEPWLGRVAVIEDDCITAAAEETERFVATPGMSAVCSAMASELADCRFGWQVQSASRDEVWRLRAADGRTSEADALVLGLPPEQVGPLLRNTEAWPAVGEALGGLRMDPCWALLTVLDRPLLDACDAAFVNQGPLAWVCNQATRPGRPPAQAWVLHASPGWSRTHLEACADEVASSMLAAARALPGVSDFRVEYSVVHRWRYAVPQPPLDVGMLSLPQQRLALIGDWCAGSRVEGAFLSGAAAAGCFSAPIPIRP
jgi:predicted NAD/FAD-dependent oxidoreductase